MVENCQVVNWRSGTLAQEQECSGGYLATLQGRCRRSSGSLQIPYRHHHFCRVWGCKALKGFHSCHLVEEAKKNQTRNTRFPHNFLFLKSRCFGSDVNPSFCPSSSSISLWLQPNRKDFCFLPLCHHRQETGSRNEAQLVQL